MWSPPEVLRKPSKVVDPSPSQDVYSFGMVIWELFHECVPFEGDMAECTK